MIKIQRWNACLLVALAMASGAIAANAQLTRGFVSGTLTDATGAILAGVQVTITNTATNIARETISNDTGLYRFAAVEPGTYRVEFRLAGFEARKVENISVSTAQEVTLNQAMSVGGVTTEISVTETPGVELAKTTATIERTFSGRLVVELPLNNNTPTRNINILGLLAPTVARSPGQGDFSANGQRARNNNYTVDGIDNNDATTTITSSRILPEAVQEVQIQTEAYSAEFGRNSGGQLSVVTRGGSNKFHGEGWDYYRGNWMEPISLTNKRAGKFYTPRFDVNQFGGDIGGPIVHDRTFFFGLAEWDRRREAASAGNATSANIPTPTGYAALSTIPLAAGQSPASRQSVLSALAFLPSIYPQVGNYSNLTNVTINGAPIQIGTILIPLAQPYNFFYSAARVDHKFSDKDNLSYRYHIDKRDQPNLTDNTAFGTRWTASQAILRQNHALSYTRTFNSRFLNEARMAYVRGNLDFPENDSVSSTVGIATFFTIGGLNAFPQGRLDHTWQYQDVASYTVGHHAMKFGADLRRYVLFNNSATDSKGTWAFASLADFINNQAGSLTQAVNQSSFLAKQWNHSYFFQDDFKLKQNLTLNLGMRYEYSTVPLGFLGATDPAIQAAGVPGPVQPDTNNWAPRFGVAYSPTAKTAIRGGFGMAYDILFFNVMTSFANNYPRVVNSQTTPPDTINLFPTLAPKTPVLKPFDPMLAFTNAPADTQNPTTNFWSLSVQRELSKDYVLEVGYTGNRSYHQIRQGQSNPPVLTAAQAAQVIAAKNPNVIPGAQARRLNPNWGSRTTLEATAKAAYEAGYIKFDRRMSKNLLIGANYTYSGNWSDNDESIGVPDISASAPQTPEDYLNYRKEWSRSIFDRPHRFAVHYLYEIPWVPSGWASQALGRIMGGWQIAGFVDAQSGQPFTVRTGADSAGIGLTSTPQARPDFNPNGIFKPNYNAAGNLQEITSGGLRTFYIPTDGSGIVTAPLGPNGILANSMPGGGNLGRNTFRGPGFQNWNFSMMKKIAIKEDLQLQVRSDFSNLFNHTNFTNPVAVMNSATFGQNTATPLTDDRLILFSAKLKF